MHACEGCNNTGNNNRAENIKRMNEKRNQKQQKTRDFVENGVHCNCFSVADKSYNNIYNSNSKNDSDPHPNPQRQRQAGDYFNEADSQKKKIRCAVKPFAHFALGIRATGNESVRHVRQPA